MYLGSFSVDFISPSIAGIWVSPCIPCASQKRHCGRKGRCQHHYQFFHFSFLSSRARCLHVDTLGAGKKSGVPYILILQVRHRQTPFQNMTRRHATRTHMVRVAQLRISLWILWRSFPSSDDTLLRTLPGSFGISGVPGLGGTRLSRPGSRQARPSRCGQAEARPSRCGQAEARPSRSGVLP